MGADGKRPCTGAPRLTEREKAVGKDLGMVGDRTVDRVHVSESGRPLAQSEGVRGVRVFVVAVKRRNGRGAKGDRKVDA